MSQVTLNGTIEEVASFFRRSVRNVREWKDAMAGASGFVPRSEEMRDVRERGRLEQVLLAGKI
jgi:hypothetical protein